jgi:hypothetical protein
MRETSRVFFLDPKKKVLADSSGLNTHRFIALPQDLSQALEIATQSILEAHLNSERLEQGALPLDPLFFAEHWKEERSTAGFSVKVFLETLMATLKDLSLSRSLPSLATTASIHLAVPFNLLECGAAIEDHDQYETLADIFRGRAHLETPFELFLFRPTSAVTEFHLFTLQDLPLGDASSVLSRVEKLLPLLVDAENSPDFPSDAPRWAQTYLRRKQEILSLEHWKNLYENRIARDLEVDADFFPTGYVENWKALASALIALYEIEAAERNHQFKETLFSYVPELHDTADFDSAITRTAQAFFPGVHFILEDRARLPQFEASLKNPPLTRERAALVLEGAREYIERYSEYLERSRPAWNQKR